MSYPAYPEYQDTGLDWLDQMPSHWSVKRLRHVTDLNPGKSRVRGYDAEMETTFLPMEAVGEDGSLDLAATKRLSEVIDGYTYFQENDVAYAKITPCFENGKAAILRGLQNGIGFGTTELTVLRPHTDQTTPDYLFRVITSEPFRSLGESCMYGAGGQKRVPDDFARNFSIPWLPLPEQTQIARFLDHQTARIDALIAEQQRLIELLKEKRQAVISHAVTKGLDPDVAMKDSGVEWLGEAPEHWELAPLKRCASRIVVGIAEAATHAYVDDGVPILRATNIRPGRVVGELLYLSERYATERGGKKIKSGDLVTVRTGNPGVTVVVPEELDGCQCFTMLITTLKQHCEPQFFEYLIGTPYCQAYFQIEGWGAAQVNISVPILEELPVLVPSLEEQKEIVAELQRQTLEIDRLDSEANHAIKLLCERRSALISAAVTGKIDVRDWQPPSSETFPDSSAREGVPA